MQQYEGSRVYHHITCISKVRIGYSSFGTERMIAVNQGNEFSEGDFLAIHQDEVKLSGQFLVNICGA